jgi:hypothetical protein
MSKLNVVTEIASRWKRDLERCPGTGRLVRAIREWEEDGKLPLRSKYEPEGEWRGPSPSQAWLPEAARVRHLDPKRYITIRKMKWI